MEEEIMRCLKVLREGGTILYPTDTIWGIGCDATNHDAAAKIYRIKRRTETKSMIILVDDPEKISGYVAAVPEIAWSLIANDDSPLTIIYPVAKNLAANVVSGDGSVAIRVVRHEFCHTLIRLFGKPIVSTSANISGTSPPLDFHDIDPEIIREVDYAVGGSVIPGTASKPSRIVKINPDGELVIIRN